MKKYTAECIATYILVFMGTGAIIVNDLHGGVISHLGIAFTFGIVVMSMIYAFGETSGAHMNPAVTLGFTLAKRFPLKDVPGYFAAQLIGALLASATLRLLFPEHLFLGSTLPSGSDMQSFVLECILTFILMLVIFHVASGSKETGTMAAIAIGGIITIEAIMGGPISGASMNPFRSLAPAIVSGNLSHIWIYLTGPFLGSMSAVLVYKTMSVKNT